MRDEGDRWLRCIGTVGVMGDNVAELVDKLAKVLASVKFES